MNTELISPRMLEAGMLLLISPVSGLPIRIDDEDHAAAIAAAIYEAMYAKHIESLGGGEWAWA